MKIPTVLAIVLIAMTSAVFAADPPVKATITVTGDATPGATITAKAVLTISDGSTFQSIQWKQTAGAQVTLANPTSDTVSMTLPARAAFKKDLVEILEHPPLAGVTLPAHVPVPSPFEGGLQDRFGVVGLVPHALEEAAAVAFELTVTTTSGTYKIPATVTTKLPYPHATGLRNVPIGRPVLLFGKKQDSYRWTLNRPDGSQATLIDATSQYPEFTPDVAGTYDVTVTDLATEKPVNIIIHAGTFEGMIRGQDANGRPLASYTCTTCHVKTGPLDMFTPWAQTGHAEIFTHEVNNTGPSAHYGPNCLSCHTVGYDLEAKNNGFDDAIDYPAVIQAGIIGHGDALNWTKLLTNYASVAKMANIQCENCHGPQNSAAHMADDASRITLASEMCGTCHGEPARHGRYQQWQLSRHANYELAREEGTDPSCSKCHSSQGFLAWQDKNFSTANLTVTWTTDAVHPATCVTCHDPHDIGTTSGGPATNSKVRVSGNTPMLVAGFKAENVGNAALCMTCHNGRRGLRNDSNFSIADGTRAPHLGPQADVLMGENMYFVTTGRRSYHAMIEDSCITCHMEKTDPPQGLANKNADGSYGGTNHTFYASKNSCAKCHSSITAESVQGPIEAKMESLKAEIEKAIRISMQNQIRLGNAIDLGGKKTVRSANDITGVEFIESHGRQGVNVTLADRSVITDLSLQTVKVVRPAGTAVELYAVTDAAVAKAGWNYFVAHSDKSHGVHNPTFVSTALDVALFAVKNVNATSITPPTSVPANVGGGVGNYQGAVACTSPYVYWAEIAGHLPGNSGSQWRTDLVTRNLGTSTASLKFVLHQASGNLEGTATVGGSSMRGFEDIVAYLGADNALGALEVCSDQPLLVLGRIFNDAADKGTFGQNIDGHVADLGYGTGQTVSLIGLRQKSGLWRSNISVTNAGTTEAQVAITLYDANGTSLKSYNLTVPAGQVVQDGEPFRVRAERPDVDWGFATVTVLKGTNIRTMGSLVDMKTNDPTTIPAKQ